MQLYSKHLGDERLHTATGCQGVWRDFQALPAGSSLFVGCSEGSTGGCMQGNKFQSVRGLRFDGRSSFTHASPVLITFRQRNNINNNNNK